MKKIKNWLRKMKSTSPSVADLVIAGIFLCLLALWLWKGWSVGKLRFSEVSVTMPYMAVSDGRDGVLVLDTGKGRVLHRNADNELTQEFDTASGFFYQGEKLLSDPSDGSWYVQSVNWDSSGFLLGGETVTHISASGQSLGVPVDIGYLPSNEVNRRRVFDPRLIDGVLYYIYADGTHVVQRRIVDGKEENVWAVYYPDAWLYLQNFAQKAPGDVYAVEKTGKILHMGENGVETVYTAEPGSGEILYCLDIDGGGTLYYTDIYHNCIRSIAPDGTLRTVLTAEAALGRSPAVNEGVLSTVSCFTAADGVHLLCTCDSLVVECLTDGTVLSACGAFPVSTGVKLGSALCVAVLAGILLSGAYLVLRLLMVEIATFRQKNVLVQFELVLMPLLMLLTVSIITGMFVPFRKSSNEELSRNLKNMALVGSQQIEPEWLEGLPDASRFMDEDYRKLCKVLSRLCGYGNDYDSRYGVEIDVMDKTGRFYSATYGDLSIGTFYPGVGSPENVMAVYETKQPVSSQPTLSAGGTFLSGNAPILDAEGNVIAVLSVAKDNYMVSAQFSNTVNGIILNVLLAVIAAVFMLNELFAVGSQWNDPEKRAALAGSDRKVPIFLFRVSVFTVCFVLNMTSSFLSVYTSSFWNERLGIRQELAGAVPLFANSVFVVVSSLFVPKLHRKMGFRTTTLAGVLCAGAGDLLAGLSQNYPSITLALLLNGAGFGILINSVSLTIGQMTEEKDSQTAFSHFNAGLIAGTNSGMIIGAFLAGAISYHRVFYITSALWLLQSLVFIYASGYLPRRTPVQQTEGERRRAALPPVPILARGLCMVTPYAMLGSFMYYYIPIFTNRLGYSELYCTMLMLVFAACGIMLSTSLSGVMWQRLGKRSVWVALALGLLAWLLLAAAQNLLFAGIAMLLLGLSFSFGSNVYLFAFQEEAKQFGMAESDAMSIYNFFNSSGQTVSALVCGALAGFGLLAGMTGFAVVSVALLCISGLILKLTKKEAVTNAPR